MNKGIFKLIELNLCFSQISFKNGSFCTININKKILT